MNEIRADSSSRSSQEKALESQLSDALKTIEDLRKTIFDLECRNASLSDQLESISSQVASLRDTNLELENIAANAKMEWPPSQQKFEGLKGRIRELESASSKRESDISQLLEECKNATSQEYAQEKQDLLKVLNRKDAEIISFKQELESLMGMIIRYKNDQKF